jgi:exodeoxyribonuclease-3
VHPDVLCLQETRTAVVPDAISARFEHQGYALTAVGAGAYNGVAIVSRHPIRATVASGEFGVDVLDREPRVATCIVETEPPLRVASAYVPHGREVGHWHYDDKLEFLDALTEQVPSVARCRRTPRRRR